MSDITDEQGLRDKRRPDTGEADLEPYLDKTVILRGWPGYRTRAGRSGYDYIDTQAEAAHMAGVFWRHVLTGKLRTRNWFYLFFLALFGLAAVLPLALGILELSQGGFFDPLDWLVRGYYGVMGVFLLANLALNLIRR